MQTITERELFLFLKSKVVRQIEISQTVGGSFRLRIRLSVDPDDFILSGTRNKPREWASLDTLANHICAKYGASFPIVLSLWKEPTLVANATERGDSTKERDR